MPLKVAGLNGDNRQELLVYVFTGYEQKPRGLYAYDMHDKKVLWQCETGPALLDFCSVDLNGDGYDDFLFGSNAVCNGNREVENATDDFHSYVFALSHKGERLWIRQLGDAFTQSHVLVTDLDNDGKNDIVAWLHYGWERRNLPELSEDWEHGEIIRLDYQGNVTARFRTNHQIVSCADADLDHDGRKEILATDRIGNLYCLDANLSLQRAVNVVSNRFDRVDLRIKAVEDLDRDGRLEIICQCQLLEFGKGENPGRPDGEFNVRKNHEPTVIVLDDKLKILCRYRIEETWEGTWRGLSVAVADLDSDKKPELLAFSDKAQVLRFSSQRRRGWWSSR